MKDENRFFNVIWRINAVVVLVIGLVILGFILEDRVEAISDHFRSDVRHPLPGIGPLTLSRPTIVADGRYYLYALSRSTDKDPMHCGRWAPVRNFLIVDAETNESSWFLPDTTRVVISWDEIERDFECGFESVGVQLITVPEDTNGDGELNGHDEVVYLVSAGFEHEPRDILGEPVHFFNCEENDGRLFCQFESSRGRETAIFLLDEQMTLVDRAVLPDLPVEKAGSSG